MALLEDMAKALRVERIALKSQEKRIAWLENELKELRRQLAGKLGGGVGSPEGEVEDTDDALGGRRKGIPMSVACRNFPGQTMHGQALPDHEHQGTYSVQVSDPKCANNLDGAVHYVGTTKLTGLINDSIALLAIAGTDEAEELDIVPDRANGFGPLTSGDPNDEGEDVICNLEIIVGHLPVPLGNGSPNGPVGGPALYTHLCGDSTVAKRTLVPEPGCGGGEGEEAISFAGGPLRVDCQGHVHNLMHHRLKFSQMDDTEADVLACCVYFDVVTDLEKR